MTSVMDRIVELESVRDLNQVWPIFENAAKQIGFDAVVYAMANRDNTDFYYYDGTGVEDYRAPGFCDPFLEYCCHHYEVTYTGKEFLSDYPFLSESAVELIKKGALRGFISGIGIPIRLTGSERYGGFNFLTSLPRQSFIHRFADKIDTVRMISVMTQRHIEHLMDEQGILSQPENKNTQSAGLNSLVLLTERESEILHEISTGLSRKSCAEKYCLSEATVSTHIKNIYRKLGVNNRVEATRIAIQKDEN